MSTITMLDILKINQDDLGIGIIDEFYTNAPELSVFPARTVPGTSYHTVSQIDLPSGSFTNIGEGVTPSVGSWQVKLHQMFLYQSMLSVPYATAAASNKSMTDLQAQAIASVARRLAIEMGSQIFYGTAVDSKGFQGFTEVYDSTNMKVDATGTTGKTSIWLAELNEDSICLVNGNNTVYEMSEWYDQSMVQSGSGPTAKLEYCANSNLYVWAGLQITKVKSLCRIANISAETGKTATYDLIAQGIAKFPSGVNPTHIFMNRRSNQQLRSSKITTINTNPEEPLPTSAFGIPIIVTDSLTNSET